MTVTIYEDGADPSTVYHVTDLPLYDALAMVATYNRREYDRVVDMLASVVMQFPLSPRWIEIKSRRQYRRRRVFTSAGRLEFLYRRRVALADRKIERINADPAVCWAYLVAWRYTMTDDRQPRVEPIRRLGAACKAETDTCGVCYCGKFATPEWLAMVAEERANDE